MSENKRVRVEDLELGKSYSGRELILKLSSVQKGTFKSKPGFFYTLNFQDNTGMIGGKMWDVPQKLVELNLEKECLENQGLYTAIIGDVSDYRGTLQLNVKDLDIVPDKDVNPSDFLPVVHRDRKELIAQLRSLINQIENPQLKKLVVAIFTEDEYFNGFINGIGGLKHHHNYVGGLLEHTIQVVLIAIHAAENPFLFPEVNKDLVIAGGLCHDIGKVKEYLFTKSFTMNPHGIEHRYEGIGIVERTIQKHNLEIEPKLLRDFKHIIASHHGSFSDSSLRLDTPESVIIHNADCMSAHVNGNLINSGLIGVPFKNQKEKE